MTPSTPSRVPLVLAILAAAGITALGQNPRYVHNRGPERFALRVVAADLANPWEVTWGPDGWLWVTERTAFRVTRVNPADGTKRVAITLEGVHQSVVQDGLLGMALHPELLKKTGHDHVFLAYIYDRDPGPSVTRGLRVRRYTFDPAAGTLGSPVDIIDGLPAHDDHGGGRITIGPDGKLYLTRGDQGSNWLSNACLPIRSQDLPSPSEVSARDWTTYQGKVLRLELDGSIPKDNPVLAGSRSHIYSYGFRNPQGIAFGPGGLLYASEHGPSTDDEVDLVIAGKNYGWPEVAGFKDDLGYTYANWSKSKPAPCPSLKFNNLRPPASVPRAQETSWGHPDFVPPLATFFTVPAGYDLEKLGSATVAPGGLDVYTAGAIPGWASSLIFTGMRTGALYRLKLAADGQTVVGAATEHFKMTDRPRDLAISPDGTRIFVVTDSFGTTADEAGNTTKALTHPGALVEFLYTKG